MPTLIWGLRPSVPSSSLPRRSPSAMGGGSDRGGFDCREGGRAGKFPEGTLQNLHFLLLPWRQGGGLGSDEEQVRRCPKA